MSARPTCACTNISLMQLFHELKQKYPAVPDHIVSNTISSHCHDKRACEATLEHEARAALPLAYRRPRAACLVSGDNLAPASCPNQHDAAPITPITVINLDNCLPKYCTESPSDVELTNESEPQDINNGTEERAPFNFKILKSNKVKSNLNELEGVKEKPTIENKEEVQAESSREKPKRPCTLEFIKPNPGIAFKPQEVQNSTVSPPQRPTQTDAGTQNTFWQDHGYPLNLSVNVNCHMDLGRNCNDWMDDFDSPRTITSLNLTVCTPNSNMSSPVRDRADDNQVTVTVSPHSIRAPRRRAPPPPSAATLEQQRPPSSPMDITADRSLIERQKARLSQLSTALEQERSRLQQLRRETAILSRAGSVGVRGLREEVALLREQCDSLVKEIELNGRGVSDGRGGFYSNIYTGQRVPQRPHRRAPLAPRDMPTVSDSEAWQCHLCTFSNHPLLDKCEECEMPRILVGKPQTDTQDSGYQTLNEARNSACVL